MTLREYFQRFLLHDLFIGARPWILLDPPRVDWARYTAFYTELGTVLWQMIRAHDLRA